MFGIEALEVVIGLVFVYLLFSLFVTIVNEMLSQALKIRGKELRFAIERMIGYRLRSLFYEQPKINKSKYRSSLLYGTPLWKPYLKIRQWLSSDIDLDSKDLEKKITSKTYPSNISPPTFADTLLKLIEDDELREELFREAPFLEKAYERANGDLKALHSEIEDWFDEVMAYTTEWYKEKLRLVLIVLGFITAVMFNVDSISIFQTLANNPGTRSQVVQQAESFIESHQLENGVPVKIDTSNTETLNSGYAIRNFLQNEYNKCGGSQDCIESVNKQYPILATIDSTYQRLDAVVEEDIDQLSSTLGIGWDFGNLEKNASTGDYIREFWKQSGFKGILGWLITAIAISLGAPFWFDLLQRVINLRNDLAGKGKKDRGAVG